MTNEPKDNLFVLIKSLTKSEKRQFKLYVGRMESNEDSKSDARVALVLVICFVAAALFWVSGQ